MGHEGHGRNGRGSDGAGCMTHWKKRPKPWYWMILAEKKREKKTWEVKRRYDLLATYWKRTLEEHWRKKIGRQSRVSSTTYQRKWIPECGRWSRCLWESSLVL